MPIEGPPILTQPLPAPVGKSVRVNTAREISVPFRFDRNGGVAVVVDPDAQIRQHVEAWLKTFLGERVLKPLYGNGLIRYVFEDITPADLSAIQQEISDGFSQYITSARLVRLTSIDGPAPGVPQDTVIVNIQYARSFDTSPDVVSLSVPVVTH